MTGRRRSNPRLLRVDRQYLEQVLVELLEIPSPSGRTDHVMQYVGERLVALGLPFSITRRGAILASLDGSRDDVDRTVVAHADTIGCIVTRLKPDGRLGVRPIGTHNSKPR